MGMRLVCLTALLCLCALQVEVSCQVLGDPSGPQIGPCAFEIDFPPNDTNSFLGYNAEVNFPGDGDPTCDTDELALRCNASIPTAELSGRTWFLDPVKDGFGINYRNNWHQLYNVRCPEGHLLHLYPLRVRLPNDDFGCSFFSGDLVRVEAGDELASVTTCMARLPDELVNMGRGVIIVDSPTRVEFFSNSSNVNTGFVYRATCLDPTTWMLPRCHDYFFFRVWDREFVDIIEEPFPEPERFRPHKRSAGNMEELTRNKREVVCAERIELGVGDTVRYVENNTIIVSSQLQPVENIFCLTAFSELVGTRSFYGSSDVIFTGPGFIDLCPPFAYLNWTINPSQFFLPSPMINNIANDLYTYIYDHHFAPYPFIDDADLDSVVFPLRNASDPGYPIREAQFAGVRFPVVAPGSQCRHAVVSQNAPIFPIQLPENPRRFCEFFQFACDIVLRTACREFLGLNPHFIP